MPGPIEHRDPGDETPERRRILTRTPSVARRVSLPGVVLVCPNDWDHDLEEGGNSFGQTWCNGCQTAVSPTLRPL